MNYLIKFFIKGGKVEIVRAETLAEAKAVRAERFAQGDCVSGIIGTEEEMAAMEAHFVRR